MDPNPAIKWKKRIPAIVAVLLCAVTLFCIPARAADYAMHFGKNATDDCRLSAAELFEILYGGTEHPLTDGERAALNALSGVSFIYNKSIPDSVVERNYNGDLGIFTVRVREYGYTAANGKSVTWIPVSVSMNGEEPAALEPTGEGGVYSHCFTDLWHSEDIRLTVNFVWRTEISADIADGLLTLPYETGSDALEKILAYETGTEAYLAYQEYLRAQAEHERKENEYIAYLNAKRIYDEAKPAYDAYLAEKAVYDAQMRAYQEYLAKLKVYEETEKQYYYYENYRMENEAIYDAYERYIKGMEAPMARLCILESMFLNDSHGWQFYGSLMGGSVDFVLANKKEMVIAGADVKDLDIAGSSTEALRSLLKGYADVRNAKYATGLDRARAEFAYYAAHYEAIRDEVTKLYGAIYRIYAKDGVRAGMNAKGKEKIPHFQQFLSQLYILSCALNDAPVDATLKVNETINLTMWQLVEEELRLNGAEASPEGVTFPEAEVVLPDESFPEPVEKPVMDFEPVEKPKAAPAVVPDPGKEPAAVPAPGDPPAPVAPATVMPEAPAVSAQARALAEELRAGILKERTARHAPQIAEFRHSISCMGSIENKKIVTFYDLDGTKLQEVIVEYGESVKAPDMKRLPDERYSGYTFLGWSDLQSGETVSADRLKAVTSDLSLFPKYKLEDRLYRVEWNINGVLHEGYYRWGELPTCPFSTAKEDSLSESYRFAGWSPELLPVTGSASYTAQYTTSPREYTVTWIIGEHTYAGSCAYGTVPSCPVDPAKREADDFVYTFLGWNRTVQAVQGDTVYRAQYTSCALATANDGSVCRVIHGGDVLTVEADQTTVDFLEASRYARAEGKTLQIRWEGFTFSLSPALLKQLDDAHCTRLECVTEAGDTGEAVFFCLRALDRIGGVLNFGTPFPVRVNYAVEIGATPNAYRIKGKERREIAVTGYSNGIAEFSVNAGNRILYQPEYELQFSDPTSNCNLTAFPKHAAFGETVSLNANCTYGYAIMSALLTFEDGSTETVRGSFVMPKQAVRVDLCVERIVYHVTFVVEGTVISQQDLFFGSEVAVPGDPVKPEDDDFIYTFAGWSPFVTKTTGEDWSPVYTATFSRQAKATVDHGKSFDLFMFIVLPVGCTVLVALVVALVVFLKRRARRKRANAPESIPVGGEQTQSGKTKRERPAPQAPDLSQLPWMRYGRKLKQMEERNRPATPPASVPQPERQELPEGTEPPDPGNVSTENENKKTPDVSGEQS